MLSEHTLIPSMGERGQCVPPQPAGMARGGSRSRFLMAADERATVQLTW